MLPSLVVNPQVNELSEDELAEHAACRCGIPESIFGGVVVTRGRRVVVNVGAFPNKLGRGGEDLETFRAENAEWDGWVVCQLNMAGTGEHIGCFVHVCGAIAYDENGKWTFDSRW